MLFEALAYAAAGGSVTLFVGTELAVHRFRRKHRAEVAEMERRRRLDALLQQAREQRRAAWVDELMRHHAEMAHKHRFVENTPVPPAPQVDPLPDNVLIAGQNRQQRRAAARTCRRDGHEPKWEIYKSWEILYCTRCGVVEDGHLSAGTQKSPGPI